MGAIAELCKQHRAAARLWAQRLPRPEISHLCNGHVKHPQLFKLDSDSRVLYTFHFFLSSYLPFFLSFIFFGGAAELFLHPSKIFSDIQHTVLCCVLYFDYVSNLCWVVCTTTPVTSLCASKVRQSHLRARAWQRANQGLCLPKPVGAPRGPLHGGRSTRAAPRGPLYGGVADLFLY